jgi:uncharacterized protein DUF4157
MSEAFAAKSPKGKDAVQSQERPAGDSLQLAPTGPRGTVLALQRSAGNQAFNYLLGQGVGTLPTTGVVLQRKCACGNQTMAGGECEECGKKERLGLQTKLTVNEPSDIYEQEADRIADQVMAMPAHTAVSAAPLSIQRFSGQSNGRSDGAPPSVGKALASPGTPLEPALRQDMEQRFGYDFSRVRVHNDTSAAESAHAVNARAYTVGRDIVFGREQYFPRTSEGKRLLAHELTHVVQQLGGYDISASSSDVKRAASFSGQQTNNVANDGEKQIPARPVTASMAGLQGDWKDDLANDIARDLDDYVAKNAQPYKHVIEVVHFHKKKELDDNIASAFTELQSLARLEKFAAAEAGREMLDVLYEAMATGDVTDFERLQANRILYARWKWVPTEVYKTAQLRDPAIDTPEEAAVDLDANKIAQDLNDDVAKNHYREVITKVNKLKSYIEDNVASHFIALQSPDKLEKFAANETGREMLDVLYEALITGDVTDFERLQTERIFTAKAKRKPPISAKQYISQLENERVMIFPVRKLGMTRHCTVRFEATLTPEGKVRVRYESMRLWECDMFEGERNTLPEAVKPYEKGLDLDPDKIVMVKLYDQDDYIDTIPALKLIDYYNQAKRGDIGKIAEGALLAATFGTGGLSGAAVRRLAAEVAAGRASATALMVARGALWADRVAIALPAVSMVVNEHREWFMKSRAGRFFVAALDRANNIAAYYGWARMGIDGARFIKSNLGQAWQTWRAERAALKLSQAEQDIAKGIDNELESILNEAGKAETQAGAEAVAYVNEHPNVIKGEPGQRYAPVGGDHKIVEVKDVTAPTGISCEIHSTRGPKVPCPDGMGTTQSTGATEKPLSAAEYTKARAEAKKEVAFGDKPGQVSTEVGRHKDASVIRGVEGISGKDVQSAHIAPSSFLKKLDDYSRDNAITILLEKGKHRSFDQYWKDWAQDQRRLGRTEVTVQEFHSVMSKAIERAPIKDGQKGALFDLFNEELFQKHGLNPAAKLELPFSNVKALKSGPELNALKAKLDAEAKAELADPKRIAGVAKEKADLEKTIADYEKIVKRLEASSDPNARKTAQVYRLELAKLKQSKKK